MTEEMIERVARAIAPAAWEESGTGVSLANMNRRKASLRHARAAIEAMREPTEEMVKAGASRHYGNDYMDAPDDFYDQARVIYGDMITAALGKKGAD